MNIRQFVQDTIEVTKYALSYMNIKQLYLVGHSWGTILGMLAIYHSPQLYKRYFGVAQVTNIKYSEKLSYNKLLEKAKIDNNTRAYDILYKIEPPPCNNLKYDRIHQNHIGSFGGDISYDGKMAQKMMINLLTSNEYILSDCLQFINKCT